MKQFLITIFSLICLTSAAQTGVVRLEFEAAINSDIYQLIPLGNRGFLVFYETTTDAGDDGKNWFFSFFDADFKDAWKANIPVLTDAYYQDYIYKDSLVYLFFLNTGRVKAMNNNFQLLTLDLKNGISTETTGSLPGESQFSKFCIAGDKVIAGLNLKNDQAAVYSIDLNSGPIQEFKMTYPDGNFIEELTYDPYSHFVVCIISNYLDRKQNKMYFMVLDSGLNFKYDAEIATVVSGKYLNTARVYIPDSAHYMLLGNYGNVASKLPSQEEYFGIESTGVFSTSFSNKKQEYMNYYNFVEFNNLRAGVSARDFYRLQSKKSNRESAEYSMNYELITHDPQIQDSTLVIMMEAFYPEFRTMSDVSYDYWGRPVTHTYTVFDGYRFFNALMVGFRLNGEMAWDNSLEINLPTTMNTDPKIAHFFDGEPLLLFYNDGTKISYRVCLENAELEPFTVLDLETSEFGDKITAIGQNYITPWFDYNFLAYGYHTIQNNMKADKNLRTVFYINKISLE